MAYAGTGTVVKGNTNSLTFAFDATPAADDFLILAVAHDSSPGTTFTWPSGFAQGDSSHSVSGMLTSSYDGQNFAWAWKKAGASESNSYVVGASATWNFMLGGVRFSGISTATPFGVAPTQLAGSSGASPFTITATGVATGAAGRDLVAIFDIDCASTNGAGIAYSSFTTSPSTWTERFNGVGQNYVNLSVWSVTDTAGTYTSSPTATATFTGTGLPMAFLIALSPATGGESFIAKTPVMIRQAINRASTY
jgi:hypothetical protein